MFTKKQVALHLLHALCGFHTFPYASLDFEGLFHFVFREALSRLQFYSLCPLLKAMVQNLLASDFIGQLFLFHRKQSGRSELPAVWYLMGNVPPSLPTFFFFFIVHLSYWCAIECLSRTLLANSISSNYSVLVHCNVPANNLKCAGAGGSVLPASRFPICMHPVVAT